MAELGGILGVVHVAAMVSHDCATHQALKTIPTPRLSVASRGRIPSNVN